MNDKAVLIPLRSFEETTDRGVVLCWLPEEFRLELFSLFFTSVPEALSSSFSMTVYALLSIPNLLVFFPAYATEETYLSSSSPLVSPFNPETLFFSLNSFSGGLLLSVEI